MENKTGTMFLVAVMALIIGGLGGYLIGMKKANTDYSMTQPTNTTYPPQETPMQASPGPQGTAAAETMTISLNTQNSSGQSGTATLTEENGKVKVVLQMTGGNFIDPQPAHIHMSKCATIGAVKYPLTTLVDGKSETMVDTTLAALKAEPMSINVHKSAAEASFYTACGDIE